MYIYPNNLRAKPTLWLWQLRDIGVIGVIGVEFLIAVLALAKLRFVPLVVLVALYTFFSVRFDDTSILDFIKGAGAFFLTRQQLFEWEAFASAGVADGPAQRLVKKTHLHIHCPIGKPKFHQGNFILSTGLCDFFIFGF